MRIPHSDSCACIWIHGECDPSTRGFNNLTLHRSEPSLLIGGGITSACTRDERGTIVRNSHNVNMVYITTAYCTYDLWNKVRYFQSDWFEFEYLSSAEYKITGLMPPSIGLLYIISFLFTSNTSLCWNERAEYYIIIITVIIIIIHSLATYSKEIDSKSISISTWQPRSQGKQAFLPSCWICLMVRRYHPSNDNWVEVSRVRYLPQLDIVIWMHNDAFDWSFHASCH